MKSLVFIATCSLLLSANLSAQNNQQQDSAGLHDKIFDKVELEADFPGSNLAWRAYLVKNLKATIPADKGAPVGKYPVVIKFIVSKDGDLSDIEAETNFGFGMEEEVIRIIKKSGKWNPAMQNGRAVNAYRRQPVTFLVNQDDFEISSKTPYTLFTGTANRLFVDIKKVSSENIILSISQGSIEPSGEIFIAHVTEPGHVIITAYNKKNNKKLGAADFVVVNKN